MAKFRIFTRNNYFYMIDIDTTIEYEGLKKDVLIRRSNENSDRFLFSGVHQAPPDYEGGIHIDDILDEGFTPYSGVQGFMDWYTKETGNFN